MRRLWIVLLVAVAFASAAQAATKKKQGTTKGDSLDLDLDAPKAATAAAPDAAGDDLELTLPPAPPPPTAPAAMPAPAPAPVETAPPPAATPAPPVGARAAVGDLLRVTPATTFGYVAESTFGAAVPTFGVGLSAEYFLRPDMSLTLDFADAFYRRTYLARRPAPGGAGLARTDVDEQRLAIDLLYAYELLPLFGVTSPAVAFAVVLGPTFRIFENAAFAHQAGAVAIGGRGTLALSEGLDLSCRGTWGYNVFFKNEALTSALGAPVAVSNLGAAIGLRLAPNTRVRLGYEGEIVTLQASYRLLHSFAVSFDVAR